jgi:PAS domain S-box-containing protein
MTQPDGKRDDASAESLPRFSAGSHGMELLERMTDGFLALDREWRIVYMNAAARNVGVDPGPDVIGRNHWEQWPETVGTEVERQYRRAMETQRPAHFEHHYLVPGKDFWHTIHAYPDPTGLTIFYRDITEQKRKDDVARLLASASSRLVSTLDQPTMMREVAELALPLLGQWSCVYLVSDSFEVTAVAAASVDPRLGTILRQVIAQLPLAAVDPRLPWNHAMLSGEPVRLGDPGADFYAALSSPELRDFVAALAPHSLLCVPLMARGRTIGGITFGNSAGGRLHDELDVLAGREVALPAGLALDTARLYEEQRQARRDAEAARQRAEDANYTKADFLRAMSHELRTPLNAIGGYVQLLLLGARGDLSAAVARDLTRVERNLQHTNRLIGDVLNFTKLEAGRVTYDSQPVRIAEVISSIEDYVATLPTAPEHALRAIPCGEDVVASADPAKVTQILINLVSNAFKHTPPGTRVDVFSDPAAGDREVAIIVRDNGPGIPDDKQGRIFEPFVQVGRTLSNPVEGLGLGLAIARDLARGMGGDLVLASGEGGCLFRLTLPREGAASR